MHLLPRRHLSSEHLPLIEPWFDDPETRRWLGGREWPANILSLSRNQDRFAILFGLHHDPVALLDLERHQDASGAVAIVVAPKNRQRGIAASVLRSLFALPETDGLTEIVGEAEHGNTASEHLLRAAGFSLVASTDEGYDRYLLHRP